MADIRPELTGLVRTHAGPATLFSATCLAWTWPLVAHLHTAIPGHPGDNYSFLWNFWWMRRVLETPHASYFRTTYLFYPFGTNLANHSHTALLAFLGATVLGATSIVTALNVLLLITVFLNMFMMYALAWDLTAHQRAAILSGILFGLSPYVAVRLLGHFELVGVWVLPLFVLCARRAFEDGSTRWSIMAGIVLALTAYVAYYYVVYLGLFVLAYVLSVNRCVTFTVMRRVRSETTARIRLAAVVLLYVAAAVALVVDLTGGTAFPLGSVTLSVRTPQNALSVAWLAAMVWALAMWRVTVRWVGVAPATARHLRRAIVIMVALFVVGCGPLLFQATYLIWTGTYVTTSTFWRSVPHGVDLMAPFLGHPANPIAGRLTRLAYEALHLDFMEGLGWIGFVPVAVLLWPRQSVVTAPERRIWLGVASVFALWALGPFLTIGGFDTGLKLPEFLAQFVPIVSNAHMPGRAIVGVYLALAVLVALRVSRCRGWLQRPGFQWLIIALLTIEYADAPIPLTQLDRPSIYQTLANEPDGGVCEAPFGIGDGLSEGIGSRDHVVLYYATQHGHPLVGGWVGRMPRAAAGTYAALPVTGMLMDLSGGTPRPVDAVGQLGSSAQSPCGYIVLNQAAASPGLVAYVRSLPVTLLGSSNGRDLFRLRR